MAPTHLRVMAFNVLGLTLDPQAVARTIAGQRPDVVALAEPPKIWGRRKALAALENATGLVCVTPRGRTALLVAPHLREHVRAVAVRSLPWKVSWLLPQFPSRRGFTAVDLGYAVVLSVHLGLNARERALHRTIIQRHAAAYGTARTIIAGDLNEVPSGPNVTALKTQFLDCAQARGEAGDRDAQHATFPARRPRNRIDYILVGSVFVVEEFATITDQAGSDHLPIVAQLRVTATHEGS